MYHHLQVRKEAARSSETSVPIYRFLLDSSTAEEEHIIAVSKNRHHINHGRDLVCQKNVACMLRYSHLQNSRYVYKVSEVTVDIVRDESYQAGKILFSSVARLVRANDVYTICAFSPCSPVENHCTVNIDSIVQQISC